MFKELEQGFRSVNKVWEQEFKAMIKVLEITCPNFEEFKKELLKQLDSEKSGKSLE